MADTFAHFQDPFEDPFTPGPKPSFGRPARRRQPVSFFDPFELGGSAEPFASPRTFQGDSRSGGFFDPQLLSPSFGGGSRSGGFLDTPLLEGGSSGFGEDEGGDFRNELLDDPTRAFQGAVGRADLTPNQRTFFETQQDEIFARFRGQQDTQLRNNPDADPLRFGSFINNFNFQRDFNRRPPRQRFGGNTARFNPQGRFLN